MPDHYAHPCCNRPPRLHQGDITPMDPAFSHLTRRTFLSASALATLATAVPAAAAGWARIAPIALASHAGALPAGWSGQAILLKGSYLARLSQIRAAIARHGAVHLTPFLDADDAVLLDIARHDAVGAPLSGQE